MSANTETPTQRTLLVVDDSFPTRSFVEKLFGSKGWKVLSAVDGQQGVAILREHGRGIDAVLCDLEMPVLDGFGLMKELRFPSAKLEWPPLVLHSGATHPELAQEASALGVSALVRKPAGMNLLEIVEAVCADRSRLAS